MSYRIELLFVGDAPVGEMDRARILAAPEVTAAITALSAALADVGLRHEVSARSVRGAERKRKVRTPDEAAADALMSPSAVHYVNSRAAE